MNKKLFVGNLSAQTTESDLQALFEAVGAVKSLSIVMDSVTSASGGFGFVEMKTTAGAAHAIAKLNNQQLHEHRIKVAEVNPPRAPQGRIPTPVRKPARRAKPTV